MMAIRLLFEQNNLCHFKVISLHYEVAYLMNRVAVRHSDTVFGYKVASSQNNISKIHFTASWKINVSS